MTPMTLSDELAMVRSRLAQLSLREAVLCKALAAAGPDDRLGRWTRARVTERRTRHFDHRLLPIELQADPSFWRERTAIEVDLLRRDAVLSTPAPRRLTGADVMGGALMGAAEANLVARMAR